MRLRFWWENVFNHLKPCCSSDVVRDDGVSVLACLLTDDGGLGVEHAIAWLKEGVKRLELVKFHKATHLSWGCEVWGADFGEAYVKVYSLIDEDYFELLEFSTFECALQEWLRFLVAGPVFGPGHEVIV